MKRAEESETKWFSATRKLEIPNCGTLAFSGSLSTVVGWSQLSSRKDKFRPFFFDVQSDKNPFFEVFKVPKSKGIALD